MRRSWSHLLSAAGKHFSHHHCFFGTAADLTTGQIEKEQPEHKIKTGETDQREDSVAVAYYLTVALVGVKKAVHQPWLPSEFGCHPAQRVGDIRERKCQHQHPMQPGSRFQPAPPILETGISHKDDKNSTQRDHKVKRV